MSPYSPDPRYWKRLYKIVSWIGIGLNTVLWVAMLFQAHALTRFLRIEVVPITWVQLCGELLGLITIFYVPPALWIDRYRTHAWIAAVISRGSGFLLCTVGVLFFGAPMVLLLGGLLDLTIGAAQTVLLWRITHTERLWPGPGGIPEEEIQNWFVPRAVLFWKRVYWFVSWVGIVANSLFFLPLIFAPRWMLNFVGLPGEPIIFAQLAGLLLGLISVFYIPAARDPIKYRLYAWLAIVPSRLSGVLICLVAVVFLGAPENFILGVFLDLPFAVAQTFILGALDRAKHGRRARVAGWPVWSREAIAVVATVAITALIGWHKLFREEPQQLTNNSFAERFKYGSIGTEHAAGVPYWIWLTLPNIFPEHLPEANGYASLGFPWESGAELPVGFSRKRIGIDRVGINCALCHTGSVQVPGEAMPRVYVGGAAVTQNILAYQQFLFRCGQDPRFESGTIMNEIARQTRLSILDRILYKFVLIPATRKALVGQAEQWKWSEEPWRPAWGPGRIEPFNPVKVAILGVSPGGTLGTSDMEPLWNLARRPGEAYHWDGLQTDLTEVVLSSAIGDGATPNSLPRKWLKEMEDTLRTLLPPPWPFDPPEPALVEKGRGIFEHYCYRCHGSTGAETGQVMKAADVGTDSRRADMWTPEAAAAYNSYPKGHAMFRKFRSTGGYVNVHMDGIWSRAPYLHNGSVPTLADLLEPFEKRPVRFIRGLNDYDPQRVGFLWDENDPRRRGRGFLYMTNLPGNSNGGHSGPDFGTELSPEEKKALLAFLKTL